MKKLTQTFHRHFKIIKQIAFEPRNLVIFFATCLALSWVLSSVTAMQQNYELQKKVNAKQQELVLLELETAMLEIEKEYQQTSEYQELALRKSFGWGNYGEKVFILPPNRDWVKNKELDYVKQKTDRQPVVTNFRQWVNFLFGNGRVQ